MCLGIPAQIVDVAENTDLAMADVFGARRRINLALIEEKVGAGDWVMLHVGFAVSKIDEEDAARATESLAMLGNDGSLDTDAQMDPGIIEAWEKEEAVQWD